MKPTLKQRLENELHSIKNRCIMLEKNIISYKESNMLIDAAMNKIKLDTLLLVVDRIELLLSDD